jgi:hypothetical protein
VGSEPVGSGGWGIVKGDYFLVLLFGVITSQRYRGRQVIRKAGQRSIADLATALASAIQ